MQRVPGGRSTSTRRSPANTTRGALSRSSVTREGWSINWSFENRLGARASDRLAEVEARPAVGAGHQRQPAVGVHCGRVPDHAQHRYIRVAVAEGETFIEVITLGSRVVANDARLLGACNHGAQHLAGGDALLDLEPVGDHLGRTEQLREVADHALERARYEDDIVTSR